MTQNTCEAVAEPIAATVEKPKLESRTGPVGSIVFMGLLGVGVAFTAYGLQSDVAGAGTALALAPLLLLGLSLLIALGFEFVNGFHDTANAVATVIYTHSLPPMVAVVWSGIWNFVGVLVSSGAVAFGIISLLPVELILQVGSDAGFAMVFSLLIAAILWNLGTWYFGLPASSSHTLIGSIIGVGLANELMHRGESTTSGVDWSQAAKVGQSLLMSPLIGAVAAGLLLVVLKFVVTNPKLYRAPEGLRPPPWWIRSVLVLTCTGVSFAHGSNDGQKGMGLIMLILIGIVPTAYALNRAVPDSYVPEFLALSHVVGQALLEKSEGPKAFDGDPRPAVTDFIRTRQLGPDTLAATSKLVGEIAGTIEKNGSLAHIPVTKTQNVRNDMYLVDEAMRRLEKLGQPVFDERTKKEIGGYRKALGNATRFIPTWVKVAVAIALGLGTMVGWRRIVVTVGEKIGKQHLTYGQGASAELVAMSTIAAADMYGMPVSTTHVLSSGVAGAMAANGSGLQWSTVRNLLMAWVLTLPAAILLSGGLFFLFHQMIAQ
ncbi:inorganic phosphate transporter [Methylococcus mesophilus]|uniref:inorganic phosphate transporter n=1 Tax=Methylococcus mesophilus TaxID=2993564 RepID=UPI00224B458A|nr:inorganic phosphate transporter [Methylococcus mesophilus]UZR28573.1 inorganic phosphate transporter [Methylococcus mesophilus]